MRKTLTTIKQYYHNLTSTQKDTLAFVIIMLLSLLVRSLYVDFVSVYDMQHDAGTPHRSYGHLGYISYFYKFWHLPDFDVREAFQFWHPPLYHFLSAVFMFLMWNIFPSQNGNYEVLQALPLLFVTICIWIIWQMLKTLNFKGKALLFPTLLIAFNPTFILLSGSINNDSLCVLFTLLSLYLAILWYKKPSYLLIFLSAISIGLGMSSKGTSAVAAFPMAFLFLAGLIKYKVKVIPQFVLFAVTSLPLGLWWYVRNYVLFGVPINYIYRTDPNAIGFLGNVPLWQRILDFDPRRLAFKYFYVQFDGPFMEVNPITALIKSTVYGQFHFNYNQTIRHVTYPLIFIWIAIILLSIVALPNYLKKHGNMLAERISILILFAAQFSSYYIFCIEYPFVWTMDVRYAVPLLSCTAILFAEFIHWKPKWNRVTGFLALSFSVIAIAAFHLLSYTTFPIWQ